MSKRTKITAIIIVVAAAAIIAAGATLAYFTADGGTKTNTFTTGKVTVDLTEPSWNPENGKKYGPGDEIPKDPWVTNTDKTDAWVAIRVKYSLNNNPLSYSDFQRQLWTNGGLDFDKQNWELLEDRDTNGQVYMYKTKQLAKGESTTPLFTKVPIAFQIPSDLIVDGQLPSFVISVKGVGVQAENITKEDAIKELKQLAFED